MSASFRNPFLKMNRSYTFRTGRKPERKGEKSQGVETLQDFVIGILKVTHGTDLRLIDIVEVNRQIVLKLCGPRWAISTRQRIYT